MLSSCLWRLYFRAIPFVSYFLTSIAAEQPVPQTPVGIQLRRWLDAFNDGDEATLLAFHEQHLSYDVTSRNFADIHAELLFRKTTGGFDLVADQDSTEHTLRTILKERQQGGPHFAAVEIKVADSPPHQVIAFDIFPTRPPPEFLSPEEREVFRVDADKRAAVVESLAQKLEEVYVKPSVAAEMGAAIRAKLRSGQYDNVDDALEFSWALSEDLRAVSYDPDLGVYLAGPRIPQNATADSGVDREATMPDSDFAYGFGCTSCPSSDGIVTIEIRFFQRPDFFKLREVVARRMSEAVQAKGLIIDLRGALGGDPSTVSLVASYLFGEDRVHLNDMIYPRTGGLEEFWTDPSVAGDKYGLSKPLYILVGRGTALRGEELAMDLKAMLRATLVGETTAGRASHGKLYELAENFDAYIPDRFPRSPITGGNWEGVGVAPNVEVPQDEALEVATRLLKEELKFLSRVHRGSTKQQTDDFEREDDL